MLDIEKQRIITAIVDTYLQIIIDHGINQLPENIEPEMSDRSQDKREEWRRWFPVKSKISDEDLAGFEKDIGYILPADYRFFLKYKHFYELHIADVSFQSHPCKFLANRA